MERFGFIDYNGKKIFYINHSGLSEDEVVENIKKASQFMLNYQGDQILQIADFRDTFGTEKVMQELKSKESLDAMKKVKKTAVIGITGLKKLLLNAYNKLTGKNIRAFDTPEAAKEYLIAE